MDPSQKAGLTLRRTRCQTFSALHRNGRTDIMALELGTK